MLNGSHVVAIVLLVAGGCAHRATVSPSPTSQPSTLPPGPVAAVWFDVGYPPPGFTGEMQRLIVAVWGDGRVVWSDDRGRGGKPYHEGKVDPPKVEKLLADLEAAGLFTEPREVNFGPDASYTVVAADSGSKRKWLGSWHEPRPQNPNIVIDERGMGVTQPGQPPRQPSPEYAHFLAVWKQSRALIEGVIPAQGEAIETLDPAVFHLGRSKP
jgi:hypothetical protein